MREATSTVNVIGHMRLEYMPPTPRVRACLCCCPLLQVLASTAMDLQPCNLLRDPPVRMEAEEASAYPEMSS